MKVIFYFFYQSLLASLGIAGADAFICAVGFAAQVFHGHSAASSAHFILFMFFWILVPCSIAISFYVILKIRRRVVASGITMDEFVKMTKLERQAFEMLHGI
jgi:hypothetical protein